MPRETINWYSLISEATDELRSEVRRMQVLRLKPIDFGLRVRSHPDSLIITARNKMRHSEEIVHTLSISKESLESARLLSDGNAISSNHKAVQALILKLNSLSSLRSESYKIPVWIGVPKNIIVELLKGFMSHPLNLKLQSGDLADFIEKSVDPKLDYWDVSIPSGTGESFNVVPDFSLPTRRRKIEVDLEKRSLLVNEKKMRVGSASDEKIGLSKDEIFEAERIFRELPENNNKKNVLLPENLQALVAVGLSFPELASGSKKMTYRINMVELRTLLATEVETFEGDESEDENVDD